MGGTATAHTAAKSFDTRAKKTGVCSRGGNGHDVWVVWGRGCCERRAGAVLSGSCTLCMLGALCAVPCTVERNSVLGGK